MSEQKVWVEKMPESCGDCEFCENSECCLYCSRLCIKIKYINREKDCPLHSIKDHDRELVKEVCEKIKNEAYKDGFYDEDGNKIITYHINNYILDQIQKEFEDGE